MYTLPWNYFSLTCTPYRGMIFLRIFYFCLIVPRSQTHTSHSRTSCLLSSSLPLGLPKWETLQDDTHVNRVHLCLKRGRGLSTSFSFLLRILVQISKETSNDFFYHVVLGGSQILTLILSVMSFRSPPCR